MHACSLLILASRDSSSASFCDLLLPFTWRQWFTRWLRSTVHEVGRSATAKSHKKVCTSFATARVATEEEADPINGNSLNKIGKVSVVSTQWGHRRAVSMKIWSWTRHSGLPGACLQSVNICHGKQLNLNTSRRQLSAIKVIVLQTDSMMHVAVRPVSLPLTSYSSGHAAYPTSTSSRNQIRTFGIIQIASDVFAT